MRISLFFFLVIMIPFLGLTQKKNDPFRHHIEISAGRSFHGSGDMIGFIFTTAYSRYIKNNLSLGLSMSGTIHDGSTPLFFTSNGRTFDGSIRHTTAGFQLSPLAGYSLLKTTSHELQVKLGGLLRYQSSSLAEEVGIYYPAGTGLPVPVVVFNHTSPQGTFSIGLSVQTRYNYNLNEKLVVGIIGGFQFDSNGDNLTQLALSAGIRL